MGNQGNMIKEYPVSNDEKLRARDLVEKYRAQSHVGTGLIKDKKFISQYNFFLVLRVPKCL